MPAARKNTPAESDSNTDESKTEPNQDQAANSDAAGTEGPGDAPAEVGGLKDGDGNPVGEAPGELRTTSDGRVVTRPEFGGPGGPAEPGSVELFVHDASMVTPPRPISQDAPVVLPDQPDAPLEADLVEQAEKGEGEEEG